MKKITLLFVCFLAALACHAASFDETQLIGKWNVTSATGNWNNYITSINTIQFGDVKIVREGRFTYWMAGYLANIDFIPEGDADFKDPDYYKEMTSIYDFFISNGNKLHIITSKELSNNSIRLVIKELNDETMILESFDGTAQFVLSKESAAAVQTIQSDVTNQSSTIYDVQGRPVSNIQSGNIYIKGNNKFIAK